jgi:hypothetical protein
MKKRILLSLVSFFMMTAMWASLLDAHKIYVTGANGKTYGTATLTLNLKNREALNLWNCTVVLPAGVTYVDGSAKLLDGRIPEGYEPVFTATVKDDGSIAFTCSGAAGVGIQNGEGAVATFDVAIAGTAAVGEAIVSVNNFYAEDLKGNHYNKDVVEFKWTIEEGTAPRIPGDANGDGLVSSVDLQHILNLIAAEQYDAKADLSGNGAVDAADYQAVLNVLAIQ